MEKENKVLEQIVEASEIEVPQEFIDERKEQLKNNLLAQLRNAGNTFEQYLQYNGLTEELFEEYAAKDALSMLKGLALGDFLNYFIGKFRKETAADTFYRNFECSFFSCKLCCMIIFRECNNHIYVIIFFCSN